MTSPWLFAVWGIDLISQLPKGRGSVQYAVVAIDYFTKWVGQVEIVNKTIKHNLKTKLEYLKGIWVDKLPEVLWAYKTTAKTSTRETPFSAAYGYEVVVLVEIEDGSLRRENYDLDQNFILQR